MTQVASALLHLPSAPLALVLEVRWGASAILSRRLRRGRLHADAELAELLGLGPGDALAELKGSGYVVWPRTPGEPQWRWLGAGDTASWTAAGFTVWVRADQVAQVHQLSPLIAIPIAVGAPVLFQLTRLVAAILIALFSWLFPDHSTNGAYQAVPPPPPRFSVRFTTRPPPPPDVPLKLSSRLKVGMDNGRLSQLLDKPMPAKPKPAPVAVAVAAPGVAREVATMGVLKMLGSSENSLGSALDSNAFVEGGLIGTGGLGIRGSGLGGVGRVAGGLGTFGSDQSSASVEATLRRFGGQLVTCGVEEDTRVKVTWSLEAGRVVSVTTDAPDDARRCVEAAAKRLAFPAAAPARITRRFVVR